MESASDRVFGTYELLETILIATYCPRSIFIMQRVCKAWQAVIRHSTTIQKLLFLLQQGQLATPTITSPYFHDTLNPEFLYPERLTLNGFAPARFKQAIHEEYHPEAAVAKLNLGWVCSFDLLTAHGKATYRQLFLTQPPITHGFLIAPWSHVNGGVSYLNVYNPRGLTFGDVEDVAAKLCMYAQVDLMRYVKFFVGFSVWEDETYTAPIMDVYEALESPLDV